jgi:8-oxo-dGTP diphosphatase
MSRESDCLMIEYVAGFLFDPSYMTVALVKKNKPRWQQGRLNAIGGKIEKGENAETAMTREFYEETGVWQYDWDHFLTLSGVRGDWKVHFFRNFGDPTCVKTTTDEEIIVANIKDIVIKDQTEILRNLRWLIPMALDKDLKTPIELVDVGVGG